MKIETRYYVFMFLFVLFFVETTSFLATRLLQTKSIFYNPSISDSYKDYLSKKDSLLGWPSPTDFGNGNYDLGGRRISPSFPDETRHQNCISLYGDSFTWGAEVNHENAWGNILSSLVGCRVANYGVEGYGSDQAYLRFRQNANDDSSIVFLNHLSENVLRNVNQFRDLIYPGEGLGFKPRFILNEEGNLELLPLPVFKVTQYKDVVCHPDQYFQNEYFIPGGPSGLTVASFPYFVSVIKGLKHFHVRAKLRREPRYMAFYDNYHPSLALGTTSAILKEFHDVATERGKIPVIAIIPTGEDLSYYSKHRIWPYDKLIDDLSRYGIPAFNFGAEIMRHLNNKDPCTLFDNCSAHYNEEGNKLLAKIAYDQLIDRQLLNQIGTKENPNMALQ